MPKMNSQSILGIFFSYFRNLSHIKWLSTSFIPLTTSDNIDVQNINSINGPLLRKDIHVKLIIKHHQMYSIDNFFV